MKFKSLVKDLIQNKDLFAKMEQYVDMIEEKNKVMNLTGFSGDRLWQEGIYESLIALETKIPNQDIKLLDIGAGAGFPSIPFVIANPKVHLTIFEPKQKRVKFLQEVINQLKLNVSIKILRVEESKTKNHFDFITARAVAPLKALIEASHHVGKNDAHYVWLKGPSYQEEIDNASKIIKKLKLEINVIPLNYESKNIVIIHYTKSSPTPDGIPRKWAQIVK